MLSNDSFQSVNMGYNSENYLMNLNIRSRFECTRETDVVVLDTLILSKFVYLRLIIRSKPWTL